MSGFNKNGIISSSTILCGEGGNILEGTYANQNNKWNVTGNSVDIIHVTNNVAKVTPGKTYYLTCKTDKEWATVHTGPTNTVAIWLYLCKTYNTTNTGYDNLVLFVKNDSNYIRDGLWKYTIPSGYNMARVRLNTYSQDGSTITAKFWDIALIPEEQFADRKAKAGRILTDKIAFSDIIEY